MKKPLDSFHSPVAAAMRVFLVHHRALGKRFDSEEWTLKLFDDYLAGRRIRTLATITPAIVNDFVRSRPRPAPKSYNLLLSVLRRWFNWLILQEYIGASPLKLGSRRLTGTRPPFLFKHADVRRLIAFATELPNNKAGHGGLVYPMMFTLIYGLGLRVSEAAHLRLQDIDWNRGVLTIRETKFLKSRLVPVGPKMVARLQRYLEQLERLVGGLEPSDPVCSIRDDKARAIHPKCVSRTFQQLWPKLQLDVPSGVAAPRLHCLRHSFAVNTLLRWYRQGINPKDRLMQLSTFMGHVHPSSTAVYLTITAELLEEANVRFRTLASPLIKEVTS
jgi:site-specific recombinase XerD